MVERLNAREDTAHEDDKSNSKNQAQLWPETQRHKHLQFILRIFKNRASLFRVHKSLQTNFDNALARVIRFVCTHRCGFETTSFKNNDSML